MRQQRLYRNDCRDFTGYKPCRPGWICATCETPRPIHERICLVSLEALGAVLRSTSLLRPIRRRYPQAEITWVTAEAAAPLLAHNPLVDRCWTLSWQTSLALQAEQFDLVMGVDKSRAAGGLVMCLTTRDRRGFGLDSFGHICPLNAESMELFRLGIDDDQKFKRNQKPETQLLCEAMGLEWQRDPYVVSFTNEEWRWLDEYRRSVGIMDDEQVVGVNTGCSALYPYKKLPVEQQIDMIGRLHDQHPEVRIMLLGGREDTERNMMIATRCGDWVINTPTELGLRKGFALVNLADVVVTGDSLGVHMAIALEKQVVVWFGVSCPQEIDLYDRGEKLLAHVNCSPCWLKSCEREPKCYDRVSTKELLEAIDRRLTTISKRESAQQ